MFQEKFDVFDAGQPLPSASTSTVTIAQALVCEQLYFMWRGGPTPEQSGAKFLAVADWRELKNEDLGAKRVRFRDVPRGEDAIRERIEMMWHAGSRSADGALAVRVAEAIELMIDQLALQAEFDPASLAEELAFLDESHPELVTALLRGDLDDVPDLIDDAVKDGDVEEALVAPAAWMFVCWAAFEQQREAILGWRLIHKQLDEVWCSETRPSWTIGQIFRPKMQQYVLAEEMLKLYSENVKHEVTTLEAKPKINRFERTLRKMGYGWINRASEAAILSQFGESRFDRIPDLLQYFSGIAQGYHRRYRSLLKGPNETTRSGKRGATLAGKRADMLAARISAVHRTAIVCARTCHLAGLAAKARTSDDMRAMLDAHLPNVLRPSAGKRLKDWDKLRLRQLFHVVRVEFLQDGAHLPKHLKGVDPDDAVLSLELSEEESRRGHEVFDQCWAELCNQPSDWHFMTPFGWQCDGGARVYLSARA